MVQLTASDLLRIWEIGERQSSVEQTLTILAVAYPDQTYEQLLDLSLGQRDRLLLMLRNRLFGPELKGFAECPGCAQRLEFTLDVSQICGTQWEETPPGHWTLSADGFDLRFRLPSSRDLLSLSPGIDPEQARRQLAQCCLQDVDRSGDGVDADELPETVIEQLAARVVQCDPLQEILLELLCPACDQRWQPLLDIGVFLWGEVAACAKRLLRDVHSLAQAYGWSEAEILAMGPRRRQAYLDMVLG